MLTLKWLTFPEYVLRIHTAHSIEQRYNNGKSNSYTVSAGEDRQRVEWLTAPRPSFY